MYCYIIGLSLVLYSTHYFSFCYYEIYVFFAFKVAQTKITDTHFDVNYKGDFFKTDIDDLIAKITILSVFPS